MNNNKNEHNLFENCLDCSQNGSYKYWYSENQIDAAQKSFNEKYEVWKKEGFPALEFRKLSFIILALEYLSLIKIKLINYNISHFYLTDVFLTDCKFRDGAFFDSEFLRNSFKDIKFIKNRLIRLIFNDCDFENVKFIENNLQSSTFESCVFTNVEFTQNVDHPLFEGCYFKNTWITDLSLDFLNDLQSKNNTLSSLNCLRFSFDNITLQPSSTNKEDYILIYFEKEKITIEALEETLYRWHKQYPDLEQKLNQFNIRLKSYLCPKKKEIAHYLPNYANFFPNLKPEKSNIKIHYHSSFGIK